MLKSSSSIKFDGYEFYPSHSQVHFQDEIIKIEPKIMQVFCFLFQHKGEVLSRDYIAEKLWPDSVVGHEVITRAIFELRKVLNDDPKQPKYIETIPRKGYCFIGDVGVQQELSSKSKQRRKHLTLKPLILLISVACIIAISYLVVVGKKSELSQESMRQGYQTTYLSDGVEEIYSAELSKDWSKALYIKYEASNDKWQLVLKDLTTNYSNVLVEDTRKYSSVIWGEDDSIAYIVRCHLKECELVTIDLATKKIDGSLFTAKNIINVSLSSDGRFLALTLIEQGQVWIQLLSKNFQTKPLFIPVNKLQGNLPVFNDNGKSLYYVIYNNDGSSYINSFDMTTNTIQLLSKKISRVTSIEYESAGRLLIAGKTNGGNAIWRFHINTGAIEQVASISPSTSAYRLAIKKDLSKIFYLQKHSNFDISAKGLDQYIDFTKLNSYANDLNGLWSDKHQVMFFSSQRSGNYELYSHSSNENIKLTDLKADKIERAILNSEHSHLAFTALIDNQLKMFVIDINKNEIVSEHNMEKTSYLLAWASDSKSVYLSLPSKNVYDIWQYDLKTNEQSKRFLAAGLIVKQQTINESLFYGDLYNKKVMTRSEDGSVRVAKDFSNIPLLIRPHTIEIDLNTMSVFYIERGKEVNTILQSKLFEEGESKVIFQLSKEQFVTDIGIANYPHVIFDKIESKTTHLVLLDALTD